MILGFPHQSVVIFVYCILLLINGSSQFLCQYAGVSTKESHLKQNTILAAQHANDVQSSNTIHKDSHELITPNLESEALKHPDYFGVTNLFTVEDLFNARVHLGHKKGLRNEHMVPYIYGNRLDVDIIDLDQTAEHLRLALNVMAHLAYRDGMLLFLCRSLQHSHVVEQTAKECNEFAHCRYWSGGLFTNSTLQYKVLTRLPDACIFLSTLNNVFGQHKAVNEAAKMQIISFGIIDTNSDPRLITYPIPGNDDTPSAIDLYCKLFKKAILLGKEKSKQDYGS